MKRQTIESKNIVSIGFEDGAMEVEFSGGRVYRYTGPKVKEHYDGLMASDSKGSYFAQHIRHCPETQCERVVEEPAPAQESGDGA